MKNIKNIITIAVAAAIMSPMAVMANTAPDNVGNVTYMGNIVANSPMWQWTVNDYPGPRLDAKPSEATTENGVITYKLDGQPFIAVSGYLPSMSGIDGPTATTRGIRDITEFRDGNSSPIADIQSLDEPQAVSFTISAVSTDTNGAEALGKLKLKATELRGSRRAYTNRNPGVNQLVEVFTGTVLQTARPQGSCFVGSSNHPLTVSGNADDYQITGVSGTAAAALHNAFNQADTSGSVRWATLPQQKQSNTAGTRNENCTLASVVVSGTGDNTGNFYVYMTAGHIVELTPTELAFTTPVQGVWNATLNVTAYQM